ncbi:glycoside hydrolase family 127 protein [Anaerosporobacter sp.]|uniref:glycoside hydrolase family 127 protein n=1 Tax=Anaerosporobacter sp. TaxID=1872529 RepID=UPI00286F6576|nr:beta-L-arabinofuranosidase domain-containing protein [Anaerosporobacter sp.]
MNQKEYSKPIDLTRIDVTDAFWKKEMELIRKEVIPYQWEALNDRVEGAAPSYCMRNFKIAGELTKERTANSDAPKAIEIDWKEFEYLPKGEGLQKRFYGFVFQDSDFAKWIEAVAYSLTQHPDAQLEQIADEAIDIVCEAQQENGYLDTFYIISDMSKVFSNLRDHHELYCFGHLAEGAVAYYQATGKDKLLNAAKRYADYIDSVFGVEEGKCKGYPGHEIAEMALFRLYDATGEDKYLKLGEYFVNQRGQKPYYFDKEFNVEVKDEEELRYHYHQAHLPVREQKEAFGHAVRATYLYAGMADLARLRDDEALYEACLNLWNNIVDRKMYITGGIGGTHLGEAFSFDYDLPNDTAYAETCASIGLVFFARRMLEIKADSRFADIMERALYNGVLSGMALDGKSFFYVNPLEVNPVACKEDARKHHVKASRQKWFGCACCPPNIARLVSSIGSYAYTESEDTLYVHLYMGANIKKQIGEQSLTVKVESGFPWNGNATIQVEASEAVQGTLAFRIPDWRDSHTISEIQADETYIKDGYLYITKTWSGKEEIKLDFEMNAKIVHANPKVRENVGKAAIVRGPIVYCMEEVDNGKDLHLITIAKEGGKIEEAKGTIGEESVVKLTIAGEKAVEKKESSSLYDTTSLEYKKDTITLIPYYTWANRGEDEMSVWIREK